MAGEFKQYVLGRGEVYFDPFITGTRIGEGERYLGNTTSFQVTREIERRETATSYRGQKVDTEGHLISESHKISMICDSISYDNLADFFSGSPSFPNIPASVVSETFVLKRGRFYQLGKSIQPNGMRNMVINSMTIDGATIPKAANWTVDPATGRIRVLPDAQAITDGDTATITFDLRQQIVVALSTKARDVFGALRFVATNRVGPKKNIFFPMVKLTPRGAMDFKGDQWQQIPFEANSLKLGPNHEHVYVDEVLSVGLTIDEAWFVQNGLNETTFKTLDNQLDMVVNFGLPEITLNTGYDLYPSVEDQFNTELNSELAGIFA